MFKAILISLVVGALAASYAEYRFGYNLYDFLKDHILGFVAKFVGFFKHLSLVAKIAAAAVLIAALVWFAAHKAKHPKTTAKPVTAFCCGLPTPPRDDNPSKPHQPPK